MLAVLLFKEVAPLHRSYCLPLTICLGLRPGLPRAGIALAMGLLRATVWLKMEASSRMCSLAGLATCNCL